MYQFSPKDGLGTIAMHAEESYHPLHAHFTPIFQTSTFDFPDVKTGAGIVEGVESGFYYTRLANPNLEQLARKIATLEVVDLLRTQPETSLDDLVIGQVFASGMAAVSAALLTRTKSGETVIAQDSVYSGTFNLLKDVAPRLGINVVWVKELSAKGWDSAFNDHPGATLAFAETPTNPSMTIVDLSMVAEIAHQHGAWLAVDNTFATPYCQRPLNLGADMVIHSTTKYISGHGVIIGGVLISSHPEQIKDDLHMHIKTIGGIPSPFDAWLVNLGLKTFELRMQRHCENAMAVAQYLESHSKVARVNYPGLESFPGHRIAGKQMQPYGGMLSFELKGGLQAGVSLLNNVRVATLAVSLGMVDTLIQHPASMTHASVPQEDRLKMGISDGLVRLSVGVENTEDLLSDLEQALG
jgi:methionine-gamma-lyase